MAFVKPEPTTTAEWLALVKEASQHCQHTLSDPIENYLVLTLDAYTTREEIGSAVVALDFLKSIELSSQECISLLRDVGDRCLIISGLFPERAKRKNLPLSYYISIGKQSYQRLSNASSIITIDPTLFLELSQNFIGLMDILQTMREIQPKGLFQ